MMTRSWYRFGLLLVFLSGSINCQISDYNIGACFLKTPQSFYATVNISDDTVHSDKSVTHHEITYPRDHTQQYDYIFTSEAKPRILEVERHLRGCICAHKICINLCCDYGKCSQSFDSDSKVGYYAGYTKPEVDCHFNKELTLNTLEILIKSASAAAGMYDVFGNSSIHFRSYAVPSCEFYLILNSFTLDQRDNQLIFQMDSMDINTQDFCLGHNGVAPYILTCARPFSRERMRYFPFSFAVMICLLTCILCFYLFVKEVRDMPLRRPFVCYLSGILMGYGIHVIVQCVVQTVGVFCINRFVCEFSGIFAYYVYIHGLMWMTFIAYDLWRTYGKIVDDTKNNTTFLKVSLIITLASSVLFCIIHFGYSAITKRPHFADMCYISDIGYEIVYLLIPHAILCACNIAFYIMTYKKMQKAKIEMEIDWRSASDSKSSWDFQNKNFKFMLFSRAFIIMAVTIVVYFCTQVLGYYGALRFPLFVMINIIGTLQGIFLAFLFLWNPLCRKAMKRIFCCTQKTVGFSPKRSNVRM